MDVLPDRAGQLTAAIAPGKRHGLLFDGTVFLSNGLLLGLFPSPKSESSQMIIGLLLLIALVTQAVGAVLKKGGLRWCLAPRATGERADFADKFMKGLLCLHFLLFTVITVMALSLMGIAPPEIGGGSIAPALGVEAITTNFKSHYRISYADAFAVASTAEVGGILVTGDPELIQLDGVIEVEVLTRHRT